MQQVFAGVRVIELAEWLFVPQTGSLLADWGAEVIKVEHPVRGDGYRGLSSAGTAVNHAGVNAAMELANRGKKSFAADLKHPDGLAVLLDLVATADVVLTSFLPPVLDRLGLGVDQLRAINPNLVIGRGHGFGVRGADAEKGAYDATAYWARGGVEEAIRQDETQRPLKPRGGLGDRTAAVHLAFGVAGALFGRERGGEPSVVDVSLMSSALWTIGSDLLAGIQGTYTHGLPTGASRAPNPAANDYETLDGRFLQLCFLQSDRFWPDLCRAIERPDLATDERFTDHAARAEHHEACTAELVDVFASRTLDQWRAAFGDERFPWAPYLRPDEVADDPQIAANDYIVEVAGRNGKLFRSPSGAVQFDERPAPLHLSPEHGEDTESLLLELGYDWNQIAALKEAGAII
jgi:crotonobetainyl-CoA:carnitine CoA-transferase CaiB-like acyl-CoA transferase